MATWKADIIIALNELGGQAPYSDLYPVLERIRTSAGVTLSPKWKHTVQGTIEENSPDSKKFKEGREGVFYSVKGLGQGTWALFPNFLDETASHTPPQKSPQYAQGIEGILLEMNYLRRSRNPRLVEQRKLKDNYTCQACKFQKKINNKFIIEVHHLTPLGKLNAPIETTLSDLICLCPNCHRAAHTGEDSPLTIESLRELLGTQD